VPGAVNACTKESYVFSPELGFLMLANIISDASVGQHPYNNIAHKLCYGVAKISIKHMQI